VVGKTAARTKRSARTKRRREQTRAEILDVAQQIVVRDGVDGFAVSSVAEELGLTKPALYYYFASKEALMSALLLREWLEVAKEVQAAVEQTETGADAVEALMRTFFNRYRDQLSLFTFCFRMAPNSDFGNLLGPDELELIRPVNEMLYGGVEKRLRADQRAGSFPKKRDARRFAFTAHTAVIGLLSMMAMVAAASDPLVHSDEDLINDVCQTYRNAATRQERK